MSTPDTEAPGSVPPDQALLVGSHIRSLRRRLGLTLVELAGRTGLSHPFLSQLERGLTRPSLISLERIAAALGTSQVGLLSGDGRTGLSDAPARTEPHLLRDGEGMRGSTVTGDTRVLSPLGAEMDAMELVGKNREPGEYFLHDVDEFVFVIAGRVLIDLEDHGLSELGPGDSLYYPAGTRHRWTASSWAPYHILMIKQRSTAPLPATPADDGETTPS